MSDGADVADPVSVEDIQREYLDDLKCRASPAHYVNVRQRLQRTLAALKAVQVRDVQPLHVLRYRNQVRRQGASNRTANLVADSLRAMFAWAVGCGLMATNPLRGIPRLPDGIGVSVG